jgi:hypothetical protein
VRPWVVVSKLAAGLELGGRLVLAGEPINEIWWKHWGMRLDALSVYCIRKFGWFESGWSIGFIEELVHRAGLVPSTHLDTDPEIGYAIVAQKTDPYSIPGSVAAKRFQATGCISDGNWLILVGVGSLTLVFPSNATRAVLNVSNFRNRDLHVLFTSNGASLFDGALHPGATTIQIPRVGQSAAVRFEVERWVPNDELGNGDTRTIGMHVESISFMHG